MRVKDEALALLDEWDGCIVDVRSDPTGIAADLADELNISLEKARELVSKWLDTHRQGVQNGRLD